MKQFNLFSDELTPKPESKYTSKIKIPTYQPRGIQPHILELVDDSKTKRLIREIELSTVSDQEKKFLIEAAKRHNVFHYERIADYYANATPEMQHLMERSALVIIDFEKAFEFGYIKLAHDVANQYFDNYGE